MTSPFHNTLVKKLAALNSVPDNPTDFDAWLDCSGQLSVIDGQAADDEIILYAVGVRTLFIQLVFQSNSWPAPIQAAFSSGAAMPMRQKQSSIAIQVGTSGLKRGVSYRLGPELMACSDLFSGVSFPTDGSGRFKCEMLQSLVHALGLHEVVERRSFCKLDENDDYIDVISITRGNSYRGEISLVTIVREKLEAYLLLDDLALAQCSTSR